MFRRLLVRLVCVRKTCHRCTSIEDSAVLDGEPSPPVGQLIPGHMVVEDSSVWFSQTIPSWIVPLLPPPPGTWILGCGNSDMYIWICQNLGIFGGMFRRPLDR
ncbi:hypothetical protein L3X38_036183 [Prunus dulcis]|uniref:Uncharacterized protein n=1 Tax=Prunus dulcis TaxID=3755 RepID=A0AAD4YP85_PRUDU|nr:hypothetical protein L3X38_036183 [Prunus dulcis]